MSDETKDELNELVETLQREWSALFLDLPAPAPGQFCRWLELHDGNIARIVSGFRQTARRHRKGALCLDHAVRFCSAALNRRKFAAGHDRPSLPDSCYHSAKRAA
jgi:hypothetical protein